MITIHSLCKNRNLGRLDIMIAKCQMVVVRSLIMNSTSEATRLTHDYKHKGNYYDYMCIIATTETCTQVCKRRVIKHSNLINGFDQIIAFGAICLFYILDSNFEKVGIYWRKVHRDRIEVVDLCYRVCC